MALDITVEFLGEEVTKSLDNIQGFLDATKPLAEQLVPDKRFKDTIIN
jgi:hypothetical protein